MLKLINVKKIYGSNSSRGLGLDNINLTFENCEFVAVTGSSGSGKTTLVNVISGLDNYTGGEKSAEEERMQLLKSRRRKRWQMR